MTQTRQIYLIRHGIAADQTAQVTDQERPLTASGRQKVRKVAQRLRQLEIHADQLLSSPLVRARQTAEIFREEGLALGLEVSPDLGPGGSFRDWLSWLERWQQRNQRTLALVGHQPDLAQWAELLLWGEARAILILKKAGIIGITLPEAGMPVGNCQLFWLAPPRLLL